jgi:hypothetical protein
MMTSAMNREAVRPAGWQSSETLNAVRPEVRNILERSEGFARLTPEEQRELASTMVKVSAYMSNPDGLAEQELNAPDGGVLAHAQADGVDATKKRLGEKQGFAGKDFEGGAIKQGTQQFGELVQKVDFPKFVSGLIQNVFQAIVDSSIQQMRAYGELLANVAKSVDEFAKDNISENNARDWLSDRFPDQLGVEVDEMGGGFADGETPGPAPRLSVTADDPDVALAQISRELELAKPVTDISDPAEEARLVTAARLQIARGRQQLLASMVMLGINRIVVTDGLIHAKVVFDMKASDVASRQARASMYDKNKVTSSTSVKASYGSWFSPVKASVNSNLSTEHMTTVSSSVDESSESKAEVKAKLTGEVRVNFKSDYLPMEKMASPEMIAAIQGNAQPPAKAIQGA